MTHNHKRATWDMGMVMDMVLVDMDGHMVSALW